MVRLELECAAERLLVPAGQLVRLGRHELVEEALHLGGRDRARELGGHTAVAERLHRGDPADAEALGEALVLVHVQLRELDLAGAVIRGLLERGTERLAGPAPVGPEVHHHGQLAGALDHARHEVLLADVEDRAHRLTETFFITMARAGLTRNAAYLVRPDSYVALAEPEASAAKLKAYLDEWGVIPAAVSSGRPANH